MAAVNRRKQEKAREQLIIIVVGSLGAAVSIFLAWGLGVI